MRLEVWSALPPAPSGIADYVAESLPELLRHSDLVCCVEDPARVGSSIRRAFAVRRVSNADFAELGSSPEAPLAANLPVYHLGNSPEQGFAWRRARRACGVIVLHEWCLAHVVGHETLGRGDRTGWRREARLERGAAGSVFARFVEDGLGGSFLPLAFPMNRALLHEARGVVTLSKATARRVGEVAPRTPLLALPLHFAPPPTPPHRDAARASLGLAPERFVVVVPGLATSAKRIGSSVRAVARLVEASLDAELIIAGEDAFEGGIGQLAREAGIESRVRVLGRLAPDDFWRALAAADVVLALRFPSHGETSAAAIRALGLGACVVLTAGSETALDLPRGTYACVNPGASEVDELAAVLGALCRHPHWRGALGGAAAEHIHRHHSLVGTVQTLAGFLKDVCAAPVPVRTCDRAGIGLPSHLLEEAELAALEIGVDPARIPLETLAQSLVGGPS